MSMAKFKANREIRSDFKTIGHKDKVSLLTVITHWVIRHIQVVEP